MDFDVRHKVNTLVLSPKKCLFPVFEAVTNAVHAIDESKRKDGNIEIVVHRDQEQKVMDDTWTTGPVAGFTIRDNGVGFNESNLTSFNTGYSDRKVKLGGKGAGRFVWLKTFEKVHIESTYQKRTGEFWKRECKFVFTKEGVESSSHQVCEATDTNTSIRLEGFKADYKNQCPKNTVTIARRIVEHFVEFFILKKMPKVIIRDEHEDTAMTLQSVFDSDFCLKTETKKFTIRKKKFSITHLLVNAGSQAEHRLNFCANDRAVTSEKANKYIPNLQSSLSVDGKSVMYWGYVSSKFLDDRVSPERTRFDIFTQTSDLEYPEDFSWEEIISAVSTKARTFLHPLTNPINEAKKKKIREFVDKERREYRPVLKHCEGEIDEIPAELPNDDLDLALYRISQGYERKLKERAIQLRSQANRNLKTLHDYTKKFEDFLEQWNEYGIAQLARHIVHRKATISFIEDSIGQEEDGKYPLEKRVHEVILPMNSSSEDLGPDHMNLWMIDERLSYHSYLASDKRLDQIEEAVEVDSDERSDILIFNRPLAFSNGPQPFQAFGSVIIIEFKRPGRDDYNKDDNPIEQVYRYVTKLRGGKAKDRKGGILKVPDTLPFYAYIIADLTTTLIRQAKDYDFTESPDGAGFFKYSQNHRAYIEIIPFAKMISDANKRNQYLFDQLRL